MINKIIKKILNLSILNITNNILLFKGLKKLKLIPFKSFKIYILSYNKVFKDLFIGLVKCIVKTFVFSFLTLFTKFNFVFSNLNFVKPINKSLYNLYSTIFYFRQIANLKELNKKRKKSINPKLRLKTKKLKKKYKYKKRFIDYVKKRRKINVNFNMFTKKLRRKHKNNIKLKNKRRKISENVKTYIKTNQTLFTFEGLIKNLILPKINDSYYIIYRINKLLNLFKKNKNIFFIKTVTENILKKIEGISLYLNHNLFTLKMIENFDKLFKTLFISKIFQIKKGKSYNRKFYKNSFKIYFFSFIFVLFSLLKKILFLNAVFNIKSMHSFLERFEIFFSAKNIIGFYATRYIY